MGSSFPHVEDDVDAGEKGDRKRSKVLLQSSSFSLTLIMLCFASPPPATLAQRQIGRGGGTGRGMKSTTIYLQTAVTATVIHASSAATHLCSSVATHLHNGVATRV
jgi:hypothetical protein